MKIKAKEIIEAYQNKDLASIDVHREIIYFTFKKHFGLNPEDVDEMHPERVKAWLGLHQLEEDNKTVKLAEIILKMIRGR